MSILKDKYQKEVVKALKATGRFPSTMDVPRLSKVVVNMSVNALVDRDTLKMVADDLAKITGQRPTIRKATKSISNFKLREGMAIGAKVTLRGARMYDFVERLIHATLPAHPRLPGRFAEGVRRTWKLHLGLEGADAVPRDRVGQGQAGAGHGYHDRNHREEQ